MKTVFIKRFVLFAMFMFVAATAAGTWQESLRAILKTDNPEEVEKLLGSVISDGQSWQELYAAIQAVEFPEIKNRDDFFEQTLSCSDGQDRPYVTYIPPGYNPADAAPLIVYLHGGVSREDLIEDRIEYARECPYTDLAREMNWLVVFPFGQAGATWWDEVGMDAVLNIVRQTRADFNVDDDRVYMTGFSDGASASYLFAMIQPSGFAGFIPLNGHMGVGSLDGELPLYAENMSASPLYVVNTDIDPLYPSTLITPMIDMAMVAGGDIMYREYHGIGHDFAYADQEMGRIQSFIMRHVRDPICPVINWRTAQARFGKCKWFQIEKISTSPPLDWHEDANLILTDHRITFGFFPDEDFKDKGVKVKSLLEGNTLSKTLGLQAEDIIIAGNQMKIQNMEDLDAFKMSVNRGDEITLGIQRDAKKLTISGQIPEPVNYYLFPRNQPSAAARVRFQANTFFVEGSRIEAFSIFIHPDMVQLSQEVVVIFNQQEVFRGKITCDPEFMVRNFLKNRDRKALYVNRLSLPSKNKPEAAGS